MQRWALSLTLTLFRTPQPGPGYPERYAHPLSRSPWV